MKTKITYIIFGAIAFGIIMSLRDMSSNSFIRALIAAAAFCLFALVVQFRR